MKKFLLLSAGALLSLSAMAQVTEPTLTQDWKSESVSFSAETHARWGAGFGGKVYVNDKNTKTLYSFSKDATSGEVKQETILNGTSASAMALACDGAGNILMSNGWAGNGSMRTLMALKAGTTTPVSLSITDSEFATLGTAAARMDYLGRGVGDIFSEEGGVFFLLGGNQNKVFKLFIANGAIDLTKSKAIDTGVESLLSAGVYNGVVVPMTNDVASDLVALRFSNTPTYYNNGTEFKSWARESNKLPGLDYFELNDVPYIVVPAGADALDGFAIVDRKSNKVVATHTSELNSAANTGLSNALSVEKVSDTKVHIYQYFPNQFAAQYTFEVPAAEEDDTTAIESVVADNAAVEYFNLQGVKVANPQNGLFIKKQGNKAVKVIL